MSKRLFVAIDLPDSTRQLLARLDPHIRGVRWTDLTQMHLTLGFFDDVPDDAYSALREKLSAIQFGAFFLPIAGVGAFSAKGENYLDWGRQGAPASVSDPQTRAGIRARCRVEAGSASVASAHYHCEMPGCFRAIAQEVSASKWRTRRRNDPRRSISSLFEQTNSRRSNSYARTNRALPRLVTVEREHFPLIGRARHSVRALRVNCKLHGVQRTARPTHGGTDDWSDALQSLA